MKPNILILSIDSLRADKVMSETKTSITKTIDHMKNNGVSFHQAISSADSTGVAVGSFSTGKFSIKTGSTQFGIDPNMFTFFDLFRENGYKTYATVPDLRFFSKLTKNFTETEPYVYLKRESWLQLVRGIGDSIINRIKTKNQEPWLYFIHLLDLHAPFYLPEEYNDEKFGKTRYDKMVSSIDSWLGKIINEIDISKTIIILTSDHGDYIPVIENWEKPANFNPIFKKLKKNFPSLELIGVRILHNYLSFKRKRNVNKLKKKLTEKQYHELLGRAKESLYDDAIRIPLIFYGCGIEKNKNISQQVRQVDIFPTIADLVDISNNERVDGKSLKPLINGESLVEIPAYIETGKAWMKELNAPIPKTQGKIIGIRTSEYKYWRSRDDPKENVVLFDLKKDPEENQNIANENLTIVNDFESKLQSFLTDSNNDDFTHVSDNEGKMIEEELRKMGYIN